MRPERQRRTAFVVCGVSGVAVLLCLVALAGDYVVSLGDAAGDARRVEQLEQEVKTDFEAATELHEQRDLQTAASMARQARGRVVAWTLLVASAVFVASGKWSMTLRSRPLPRFDDLVAERFAPRAAARSTSGAPAAREPVEAGIDPAFVDRLIERLGTGREAAIPILQAIQVHYRYLPDEVLTRLCRRTEITPAEIAGTSSFYARFRRSPVGRRVVRVCHGTACHVAGAEPITRELRRHLGIEPGEDTDPRRRFTIDQVACLGCCSLAPVMMIEEETLGRLSPASARQALDAAESGS